MELSDKTARQLYAEFKANPTRKQFGFGRKPILVNIDLQKAYTLVGEFKTAYETDPKQLDYVNALADLARSKGLPVAWTYVAYMESGEDCGVWGTRSDTAELASEYQSRLAPGGVRRPPAHRPPPRYHHEQADGLRLS